jgi:hypothetical protein
LKNIKDQTSAFGDAFADATKPMRELSESMKGLGEFNFDAVKKSMEPINWSTNWIEDSMKPLREAIDLEKGGIKDTNQQGAARPVFGIRLSKFTWQD